MSDGACSSCSTATFSQPSGQTRRRLARLETISHQSQRWQPGIALYNVTACDHESFVSQNECEQEAAVAAAIADRLKISYAHQKLYFIGHIFLADS